MTIKNSFLLFAIGLVLSITGCGKGQTNNDEEGTEMTQTMLEIFPEPQFAIVEFSAVEREQPNSVDEAIASLDSIKSLYDWSSIPAALNGDLSSESVYQYVKAWKLLNDQIPHDVAWLKNLDASNVPGVDNITTQTINNTKKQQLDWLENRLPKQMENSAKYTRQFLEGCVAPMMWNHIEKASNCDMSNSTEVANTLSRQNINELRAKQIQNVAIAYESLVYFDQVMGIESDWDAKKEAFREIVVRYQDKLEQAADAIQPPADINNAELMEIAKTVLADEKYELPEAVRIIVNAPKKSFGKDHYTIDFDERSIEKSPYRWEEFQVATIEKEGDQHYLYYNTILYYSVGPHTVPTEKWVLGPRHKSAPIAEKNIND